MTVRLAGVAIFMIAALYTWYGRDYTASFGDVLGPSVFPVIVGIPAMILSASLVVFPIGQVQWPDPPHMLRQVAALAILLGYALLLRDLGFPLATFGLILGIGIVLGGAPLRALILAAIFAPALWALFDQILGLPLAFLGRWFD
ncbi:Tripartite tricarboxylate transporter TctB family protein [Roseovarius tolerans]|jgi:putative tricarboxylic transport membrane protein|uniref:Tripartite tricarboxylate transporter TctB family protein n=1 Tax=Roseovarius tolerans TaxID=74031 RepID=A0A0L6CQF8_9RHOB|nr:tripartite tricarboxylate transporter TctB family protein [Roseovarius tolerans]KNX39972.1 Tripartite tricarboxylate transporter TctB family protein [Roseovarius tolerans]